MIPALIIFACVFGLGLAIVWLAWFWCNTYVLHAWEPRHSYWSLVWRYVTGRGLP